MLLYVAGYFCCPTEQRAIGYDRDVYSVWLARLYAPAARLESAIVGTHVNLRYHGEFNEAPQNDEAKPYSTTQETEPTPTN